MSAPKHVLEAVEQALISVYKEDSDSRPIIGDVDYVMRDRYGHWLGTIAVEDRADIAACEDDFNRLTKHYPAHGSRAVSVADVHEKYRGLGVGSRLYEKALLDAADRGLVLVPDKCTVGGTTSVDAQRVWDKLKASYVHEGNVVFGVRKRGRR